MGSYLIINTLKKSGNNVNINAYGQANLNAKLENRQFSHSELLPTGYFTNILKPITITLKDGFDSNNTYLQIGQWGTYKSINNGTKPSSEFYKYQLTKKTTEITPEIQGMIYLTNYSKTASAEIESVTGEGIYQVPTFKIGKTDQQKFLNDVAVTKSPFVEFISNHVFLTMQTYQIIKIFLWGTEVNINIEKILENWDEIWKYTNELYGLNPDYSGTAKKYQQYIHIANPDTGAGYASATNYHITFQNDTSAGADLFTKPASDLWGLWHEIGHTYQTPQYQWSKLTEVTVNISALYVQQKLFNVSRLDNSGTISAINTFFAEPDNQRKFDDIDDLFIKLAMFWQLQMAFGDYFYPTLLQTYRLLASNLQPGTTEEKQQLFIQKTSEITDRNLIPFFEKWGLWANQETTQIVSKYPNLSKNIWENIINNTHQPLVETPVAEYKISTANISLKDNTEISFGTDINTTNYGKYLNYDQNVTFVDVGPQSYYLYQKNGNKYYTNIIIGIKEAGKLANKYNFSIPIISYEDNFINFINNNDLIDGIQYQENYVITLELQEPSRVMKFNAALNDWEKISDSNAAVTKKYQIVNNSLLEIK